MADQDFDPLPEKIASDPKFAALSPEAQAVVRQKWAKKFALLSPEAQETVRVKRGAITAPEQPPVQGPPTFRETAIERRQKAAGGEDQPEGAYLGKPTGYKPETSGPGILEAASGSIMAEKARSAWEATKRATSGRNLMSVASDPTGELPELVGDVLEAGSSIVTVPAAGYADVVKQLYNLAGASEETQETRAHQGDLAINALLMAEGAAQIAKAPPAARAVGEGPPLEIAAEDFALEQGPPKPPPKGPRIPTREEWFEKPTDDLAQVGNQPPPGAMERPPGPQNMGEARGVALEEQGVHQEPIPLELEESGRGPRAPLEPSEAVPPAEYPGPTGELRQGLHPDELIGEPEPALTDQVETYPPAEPAPHTGQAGPAQTEFLPSDLLGEPLPGIEVELARQEATLEGQRTAAAELRKNLPNSESAKAIEQQADETARKVNGLREAVEQHRAEREPPTVKNPPASPIMEQGLRDELSVRGVNPDDPQVILDHIRRDRGLRKPAVVETVGVYPVSKSVEYPNSYGAHLAENRASSVLHESDGHMAEAEGKTIAAVPEGPGANDQIVSDYLGRHNISARATAADLELTRVADSIETSQAETDILMRPGMAEGLLEKGTSTIPRAERDVMQKGGEKPETLHLAVSEAQARTQGKVVGEAVMAARKAADVADEMARVAKDRAGLERAEVAKRQAIETAEAADAAYRKWKVTKFVGGRIVHSFNLPPEIMLELRRSGRMLENEKGLRLRQPIWDDFWQTSKGLARSIAKGEDLVTVFDMKSKDVTVMKRGEAVAQLGRDLMFEVSTNLFTYFSALRDTAANATEIATQMASGVGGDLVRVVQGKADFANTRSWGYAFADRAFSKPMSPILSEMLDHKTAMGMDVRAGFRGERGAYLYRTTPLRTGLDIASGVGPYAKVAVDRAAGNLAATATLWERAIKETPKGLSPMEARAWRRNFIENPPTEALMEAAENGKKAKFDRDLSAFEQRSSASTGYRLVVDLFARWGFQAARGLGEWFGINPQMFREMSQGGWKNMPAEKIAKYVTKSLTGPMALYTFYNLGVYDKTDFSQMTYDGPLGRRRMDVMPVPEFLMVTAAMKAAIDSPENRQKHMANFKAAVKYASVPGAKLLSALTGGELGGFLSAGPVKVATTLWGDPNKGIDPKGAERAFTDQLNRAFPYQATTAMLKYILDPIEREGIGARLPLISQALPYRPSTTQGGPMIKRQKLPFGMGEVATGANVPGSAAANDPVYSLLMKYGMPVQRGPRAPLPGAEYPDMKVLRDMISKARKGEALPAEDEMLREWEENLGNARQSILGPLAHRLHLQGNDIEKIEAQPGGGEIIRKMIRDLDGRAARLATGQIMAKYRAGIPKPFRKETMKELTGPMALHKSYLEAKAAREAAQAKAMEP